MASYEHILKSIKNKDFAPIYLLNGEEPFFIDQICDTIANTVLEEHEKDFNQTILYGRDTNANEIVEQAKRFPMMAEHSVVIVKEAQDLGNLDGLESYFNQPQPTTLLVLCYKYKKVKKNTKVAKAAGKNGVFFQSEKIKDWKLPEWIISTVKHFGFSITPPSAQLLADHLGNDLNKIYKELEKLKVSLDKGAEINAEVIEKNIGISKEFNVFELQKAIAQKDLSQANLIVSHFAKNEKKYPFPMLIGFLYSYFSKLVLFHYNKKKIDPELAAILKVPPFLVKEYRIAGQKYNAKKCVDVIGLLRTYDLKSKGVGNSSATWGELLNEMINKIILE